MGIIDVCEPADIITTQERFDRVRCKMGSRMAKHEQPGTPEPRYDDVYFEGMAAMNATESKWEECVMTEASDDVQADGPSLYLDEIGELYGKPIVYPSYEAAHIATNEVLGVAVAAARLKGIRIAIIALADVEGHDGRPNVGADMVGHSPLEMVQAVAMLHGALTEAVEAQKRAELKQYDNAGRKAQAQGMEHSAALFSRDVCPPEVKP